MVNILGANSVSGGYEIDNSLRFNDGDNAQLDKTFGSAGDLDKSTVSMWIKISTLASTPDAANYPFIARNSSSHEMGIRIRNTDVLQWYYYNGSYTMNLTTNRVLRDTSAWFHIFAVYDSENGTEAHRARLYVNGVEETSFSASVYPSQNTDGILGNDITHSIGGYPTSGGQFDGYISEMHYVNGSVKAPTDFGEFNDNGVWIPKAYTGAYGTNGFYLEFKETGTGTDASGMGADTSGNDNHFAPVNLAATDVTTDTPTNNFATLNPLHTEGTTFAEGNTDVLMSRSGAWNVAMGTMAIPNSGKWYMEIKITAINASAHNVIGFLDAEYPFMGSNDTATGFTGGGTSWLSLVYFHAANDNAYVNSADGSAYQFENNTTFNGSVNDIYSMAFDRDNNKVWFGLNGVYAKANGTTGANPSTGADATITDVSSSVTYMPQGASGSSSARQQWNFGNAPHAISSGNADANGYGNFEYAVPSGFYSLCTKNLGEFG